MAACIARPSYNIGDADLWGVATHTCSVPSPVPRGPHEHERGFLLGCNPHRAEMKMEPQRKSHAAACVWAMGVPHVGSPGKAVRAVCGRCKQPPYAVATEGELRCSQDCQRGSLTTLVRGRRTLTMVTGWHGEEVLLDHSKDWE